MFKKRKFSNKYDSINSFLEACNYDVWFESEESSDTTKTEGDEEEVKEGKGLKILLPNKFLTRFPILLAQIKAGRKYGCDKRSQNFSFWFWLA